MDKIYIVLLIIILLLLAYIILNNLDNQENFATDFEALANVASLYNNSNMTVSNMTVTQNASVNGVINANGGGATNGWISGHFGLGDKDKIVIGNLENQACIGAHNKDFNAWTDLRLQGNSINMVPNNGIVNYPNGWRVNTSDGHFRIQHNGEDKFVAHNWGYPSYAPNGMDVGTWHGTGGGTLNVSGNANINGVASVSNDIKANRVILSGIMKMWADGNAFQFNACDANGNGGWGCRRAYWWNGGFDNCYGAV